jgi:hypothetical protein
MPASASHTVVLDCIALIEARLNGDDTALSCLLDHADLRACTSVLADMTAILLAGYAEPQALLARLRPVLLDG